jgi:hypothetical protein
MRRLLWLGLAVILMAGGVGTSCVVREERVVARPGPYPPCPGGVWIQGHYGPRGRWHPAHWRCPGVIEVE